MMPIQVLTEKQNALNQKGTTAMSPENQKIKEPHAPMAVGYHSKGQMNLVPQVYV